MKRGNIRKQSPLLPSSTISPRSGNRGARPKLDNLSWFLLVLSLCFISFYAGIWMAWSISPQKDCNSNTNPTISSTEPLECEDICLSAARLAGSHESDLSKKLDLIFEEKIDKIFPGHNDKTNTQNNKSSNNSNKRFAKSLSHWIQGIVQINRQDLFNKYDFGMPMDQRADNEDVLMLYDTKTALPTSNEQVAHNAEYNEGDIPIIDATTATGKMKLISRI